MTGLLLLAVAVLSLAILAEIVCLIELSVRVSRLERRGAAHRGERDEGRKREWESPRG